MEETQAKAYQRGQLMYIFEAALEYLISILVAGAYLATLTKELGMSDSLTGVLSSVISLGCLFQLLSITYRRRQVKSFVIVMSIVNQLLFMLLYVIPLINIGKQAKIVIFVVALVLAYLIYNFTHPKKISWLMALVDDHHRGNFTANKEIFSLISGMIFTFLMGSMIDHFTERGEIRTAFILSAVVILVLMVLHTATMLLTVEKPMPEVKKKNLLKNISEVFGNRQVLKVTGVFVLYYIASYMATPFYGTYQINELGFELKFVSLLTIVSSIVRISVSKFWGRYADKNSFVAMVEKCLIILALAFASAACAVPANGGIMFMLYYIFYGIAMGGINSTLINLVFDYVVPEQRADSLAICQAVSGLPGFMVTLAVSPLVTAIQNNGNIILGRTVYAQQLISGMGLVVVIAAIIYIRLVLGKKSKSL